MKKLLTLSALLGAASLSFGQGVVNFGNASVAARVSVAAGGPAAAGVTATYASGARYYYALLESTTQTTVDNSLAGWNFTGNYGTNTLTGRFNGDYTADPGVNVSGAAGTTANFVIVGWSGNLVSPNFNGQAAADDAAWSQVLAAWNGGNVAGGPAEGFYFGISAVALNQQIGGGTTPVPTIFGATGPMTLNFYAVPEPATFALAGLGMAGMLIFRRRKA